MKVSKSMPTRCIPVNGIVRVTDCKTQKEIVYTDFWKREFEILKLNKDEYLDKRTGEIKSYNHKLNRSQNVDSLRKSFKKLRNLINTNFSGQSNELMTTLTYKENMQDVQRLYRDLKNFIKRFRSKYGRDIDYITIVEPQARGAWHAHILFRFNSEKYVYVPSPIFSEIWGLGFTTIKRLKGVSNVGAYVSAYLTDIELSSESISLLNGKDKILEKHVNGNSKKYIKGGRLSLYPNGLNLYRCSRGIKKPNVSWNFYSDELQKIEINSLNLAYSQEVHLCLDNKSEDINGLYIYKSFIYEYYDRRNLHERLDI